LAWEAAVRLLVEGWRGVPHSFSLVNQYLLLEWMNRPGLQLWHREAPRYSGSWPRIPGLLDPAREAPLRALPGPDPADRFDAAFRIFVPYDLRPAPAARRTYVWGATEFGVVQQELLDLLGAPSLDRFDFRDVTLVTCSGWSRDGFVRSGAPADRVAVIPLGFDPGVFHPVPAETRAALRRGQGLDGRFVFLNVGQMTANKGIPVLLRAFAAVAARHPDSVLVLKGSEAIGSSKSLVDEYLKRKLTPEQAARVRPRLVYLGEPLRDARMADLYRMADAYVSPYRAEGFNLPVLEAAACGTPVVCTAGGPTDDFVTDAFALRVASSLTPIRLEGQDRWVLTPDEDDLVRRMVQAVTDAAWIAEARGAGPAHVAATHTWARVADTFLRVMGGEPRQG
jgi:glycosyltransferase involved in cell wall biosynthesis